MSRQIDAYHLDMPILDMDELLDHSTDIWGVFDVQPNGKVGTISPDAIPRIVTSYIAGCQRALRVGDEDVDAKMTYGILSGAFENESNKLENITLAMTAFNALIKPELREDLSPESIAAARTLVSYLTKIFPVISEWEWGQLNQRLK